MNATFQEEALEDPVMDEEEGNESNGLRKHKHFPKFVICQNTFSKTGVSMRMHTIVV